MPSMKSFFLAPDEKFYEVQFLINGQWVPANEPEFIRFDRKASAPHVNPFHRCRMTCVAYNRKQAFEALIGRNLGDQQWRIVEP